MNPEQIQEVAILAAYIVINILAVVSPEDPKNPAARVFWMIIRRLAVLAPARTRRMLTMIGFDPMRDSRNLRPPGAAGALLLVALALPSAACSGQYRSETIRQVQIQAIIASSADTALGIISDEVARRAQAVQSQLEAGEISPEAAAERYHRFERILDRIRIARPGILAYGAAMVSVEEGLECGARAALPEISAALLQVVDAVREAGIDVPAPVDSLVVMAAHLGAVPCEAEPT
jgi:hypothetical protein